MFTRSASILVLVLTASLGLCLESYNLGHGLGHGLGLATAGLDYIPEFWQHSQATLSKLYLPAMRALSVSASSAAVERVFSHGGITHE